MAYDGTLKFDTSMDASGFQKGASKLGDIVNGLGIFEVIKKGFNMIVDSLDAAMGRLDTMDQFNRVMGTMTGSTEKANKALKETTTIVTGTAYGLDTASKGVQAFVASGMKVADATDTMAAWADATSFYTKGTNAELETVSTALQKMQTKGTVTMEHLQMLLEAGIPAVQIYADAVGMSTDEVSEAMGKGELKTSDFITAMNRAFETGTSGFPSVAGAAKEAGDSWSGSIDNMKAAITRGTASILTSFDKMFNVKSNMVAFGKSIETVMKGIAENMDIIAPIAIAATAAIVTLKVASSVSTAVSALNNSIKLASKTVQLFTVGINAQTAAEIEGAKANGLLTSAIAVGNVVKAIAKTLMLVMTGATWAEAAATASLSAAWTALNTVIFASPLGWILLAIVGVVAAISAIVGAVKRANKEYYAEKDALKDLEKEHEGYADALNKSKDAARNEAAEKIAQVQNNRDLLNSLASLVDENGKVIGSTGEVRSKVKELNKNIEGLGLAFDEATGQVNMGRDELKAYGDALDTVTEYEAAQDEYNNILKERNSLQAKINALEAKKEIYNKMLQDGTISQSQYNKLTREADGLLKDYGDSMNGLEIDVNAYKIAVEDAYNSEAEIAVKRQEIINNQMKTVEDYAEKYQLSAEQILNEASRMEGGLEEWGTKAEETYAYVLVAQQDYVDQIKAGNVAIDASYAESLENRRVNGEELNTIEQAYLDRWNEMNQAAVDHYKGQQQEIVDAARSSKDEIILSEQQSADERLRIQAANNEATAAYVDNYNSIWRKIPMEHRQYLSDMTIEDARFLNDIASTWDEGGKEQWDQYVSGIQESMATSKELIQGTAEEYGADVVGGTVTGMESATPAVSAAAENAASIYGGTLSASTAPTTAAQQIADGVTQELTSADYSGITTGISTAISAGMGGVTAAMTSLSSNVQSVLKAMSANAVTIATSMMAQITFRISVARDEVLAAIDTIMAAVTEGFRKTDDVYRAVDAIVTGVLERLGGLVPQSRDVIDNMFSGMASAMDSWAPTLYNKADDIAAEIIRRLNKAFDIHSPSRVMAEIFGNVMQGMVRGMDTEEGSLFRTVDNLTDGILGRFGGLDISDSLLYRLRNTVAAGRSAITPAAVTYARTVSTSNNQTVTNNNNKPTFVINKDADMDLAIRKYDRMLARKLST